MLQSCVVTAAAVEDVPGAVRLRRAVAMWHRQTCAVWATAAHDSTPESILTVRARSVNQPPGTTSSHLLREIPVLPIYFWTRAEFPFPVRAPLKHFVGSVSSEANTFLLGHLDVNEVRKVLGVLLLDFQVHTQL